MLHFFGQPVDHTNRATWDGWRHVAFIGEIDSETGTITVYDGGSGSITKRNFKWTFSDSEDSQYNVNNSLKTALVNYSGKLIIIYLSHR